MHVRILTKFEAKIIEYFQTAGSSSFYASLVLESAPTMRRNCDNADLQARLSRARKFIDDSYYLPLDLSEISRQACLSRYHFLRLFRDAFNTTPHQYLIQRRIERAKE